MRQLKSEQFLPIDIQKAWDFFSSPKNLNEITPPEMTFKITSKVPEKMYPGLFITYKISPFLGIKLDWCTEITHVKDGVYFVDEQRLGPYRIWHHEHHFEIVENGVLMTDILHYDIGKSFIGWVTGKLFIDAQVNKIFKYREARLRELFP